MSNNPASINQLFDSVMHSKMCNIEHEVGENGAIHLSEYGLCSKGTTPQYVGALVALETELRRGSTPKTPLKKSVTYERNIGISRDRIINLIDNVVCSYRHLNKNKQMKIKQDLILIMFNLRSIRTTYGKGERTLSYWMFLKLYDLMPKTMIGLLPILSDYGSFNDYNNLIQIIHSDMHTINQNNWYQQNKAYVKKNLSNLLTEIYKLWAVQLLIDFDNMTNSSDTKPKISLAAKWVPKEGRALDKAHRSSKSIAKFMFPLLFSNDFKKAMRKYRTVITSLNKAINTTERLMASKQFSLIKFELVPGRCLTKCRRAWLGENKSGKFIHKGNQDRVKTRENNMKFLSNITKGKVSAKGKSLFIHELASLMMNPNLSNEDKTLFNAQFQNHIDDIKETAAANDTNLGNAVCMADVSGSMNGDPMNVALGLSVVMSAPGIASPAWENIVLTFSDNPTFVKLKYPETLQEWNASKSGNYYYNDYSGNNSIYKGIDGKNFDITQSGRDLTWDEKIRVLSYAEWGGTTNFEKAIDLIASHALNVIDPLTNKCVRIPDLYCITDMQWNVASSYGMKTSYGVSPYSSGKTTIKPTTFMEDMRYKLSNLPVSKTVKQAIPTDFAKFKLTVWNVRGGAKGHAGAADTDDFCEVSGFSTNTLKLFLKTGNLSFNEESQSSWDLLRMALDSDDYNDIRWLMCHFPNWYNKEIVDKYPNLVCMSYDDYIAKVSKDESTLYDTYESSSNNTIPTNAKLKMSTYSNVVTKPSLTRNVTLGCNTESIFEKPDLKRQIAFGESSTVDNQVNQSYTLENRSTFKTINNEYTGWTAPDTPDDINNDKDLSVFPGDTLSHNHNYELRAPFNSPVNMTTIKPIANHPPPNKDASLSSKSKPTIEQRMDALEYSTSEILKILQSKL